MAKGGDPYHVPESVRADFSVPEFVDTRTLPWLASPHPGVERRMLDRVGGEVARATSIVRYAPSSRFAPHTHDAGEEFLVLDGTFSDEHGEYPKGSYVRNPPGSRHTPFTEEGCVILVKLRQMQAQGEPTINLRTDALSWQTGRTDGHAVKPLFDNPFEQVALEQLDASASLPQKNHDGIELFVLSGELSIDSTRLATHNWARLPTHFSGSLSSHSGATFWTKRGHLRT